MIEVFQPPRITREETAYKMLFHVFAAFAAFASWFSLITSSL